MQSYRQGPGNWGRREASSHDDDTTWTRVRPLRADHSLVFLARACSPEADNKGHKLCHVMEQEVG